MLQAEVTALKTLVITSTPSSPNRELHPQLQSPSKAVFRKGHGRNKSTSSAVVSAASQNVTPQPVSHERREVGEGLELLLVLCSGSCAASSLGFLKSTVLLALGEAACAVIWCVP